MNKVKIARPGETMELSAKDLALVINDWYEVDNYQTDLEKSPTSIPPGRRAAWGRAAFADRSNS